MSLSMLSLARHFGNLLQMRRRPRGGGLTVPATLRFNFARPFGYFWRRKWKPTPVLLPGKSHGRRSLVVHGVAESDTTEQLHFSFPDIDGMHVCIFESSQLQGSCEGDLL